MSCEHVAFHTAVCQGVQWTGQLPAPSETLFLVCEQLAPASSGSWESALCVCLSVRAVACCRVGGSHLSRYLTNSVLWCVLLVMMAKEKPPITVVGDVGGRIAIIVDDIIDDVESFVAAAEILKERGAYKIYVMATHGILSAEAPRLIEESPIDEVVVTNTVPHELQKLQCPKIKTVDISLILSEAIRRIHNGESMAYLFRNITVDD